MITEDMLLSYECRFITSAIKGEGVISLSLWRASETSVFPNGAILILNGGLGLAFIRYNTVMEALIVFRDLVSKANDKEDTDILQWKKKDFKEYLRCATLDNIQDILNNDASGDATLFDNAELWSIRLDHEIVKETLGTEIISFSREAAYAHRTHKAEHVMTEIA